MTVARHERAPPQPPKSRPRSSRTARMPGDDPAGRAGVDLDLGRQGFAGHDDPACARRPAGSARGGSRAARRGRMARHHRPHPGDASRRRAAHLAPVASGKTLLERVEERRMWPSNSTRWCTSDFKTGPIERELRRYLKANPGFGGRLVNAMGMRADESAARARKVPWRRNERMSVAGREVFDWLPSSISRPRMCSGSSVTPASRRTGPMQPVCRG